MSAKLYCTVALLLQILAPTDGFFRTCLVFKPDQDSCGYLGLESYTHRGTPGQSDCVEECRLFLYDGWECGTCDGPVVEVPGDETLEIDCNVDLTPILELGNVLDADLRTLDVLFYGLDNTSCQDVVNNDTTGEINLDYCNLIKNAVLQMLQPDGVCYAAIEANRTFVETNRTLTEANGLVRAQSIGSNAKTSNQHFRKVQAEPTCGGNPQACNEIFACQFVSGVCDPLGTAIRSTIIAAATPSMARLVATAGTALFDAGLLTAGLVINIYSAGIAAVVAGALAGSGALLCADQLEDCQTEGNALGLSCEGAACCPGETATECGVNCCCCPLGQIPVNANCVCVTV